MSDPIDRLVRASLRRHAAREATCPDPETLAAWADGELPAAERTPVTAHAAGCARCTAHLALLARTRPASEAPPRGWLPWRGRGRWLVPLATAATVAAIWIAVPVEEPVRTPPVVQDDAAAPLDRGDAGTGNRQETVGAPDSPPLGRAKAAPAGAPAEVGRESARERARDSAGHEPDERVQLQAPRPELESRPAAGAPPRPVQAPEQPAAPPALSAPEKPGQRSQAALADAEPTRRERRVPAAAPAPPMAALPRPESQMLEQAGADALAPRDAPLALTGPGGVRVRIGPGAIERSVDGGRTWTSEQRPATPPLSVGQCVTEDVCWAAGAGGTVIRRAPGGVWQQVPLPERAQVIAVTVSDPRTAAVTVAGGRRFVTRDAGASWQLLP